MMYTMPKNLLSICVNFALATQRFVWFTGFSQVFYALYPHFSYFA